MAYLLAFARGFHVYSRQQARKRVAAADRTRDVVHLPEATALIVGVGGIGAETARLCAAFGMRVIGVDARREGPPEGVAELHRPEALDRLLPQADFVILTIPHTPETEGLFDAAKFRLMKRERLLHQHRAGQDDPARRPERGAARRHDRRGRAGRLRDRAAAGRPPALERAEHDPDPPTSAGRGPHLDERRVAVTVENARRFAAGQALTERGRQGALVLRGRSALIGAVNLPAGVYFVYWRVAFVWDLGRY